MQRPSVGDLLGGLRRSLEAQILPELPDGNASRQLKAGLHLLARLERTWDLAVTCLLADNADIESTLEDLRPSEPWLVARLGATPQEPPPSGFNDAGLRDAAQRNLHLHRILLDIADCDAMGALRARMAQRDLLLVGENPAGDGR